MQPGTLDDWQAHWIWLREGDPARPNTYVYFRREFDLQNVPPRARLRVSADTAYRLFLNGRPVGRGPVMTEPRWQTYDTYDVADPKQKN